MSQPPCQTYSSCWDHRPPLTFKVVEMYLMFSYFDQGMELPFSWKYGNIYICPKCHVKVILRVILLD